MNKLTLSVSDLVSLTGISRSSLYLEIAAGRLKARKVGRRTLVLRDDLEAFLQALPSSHAASQQHPCHSSASAD